MKCIVMLTVLMSTTTLAFGQAEPTPGDVIEQMVQDVLTKPVDRLEVERQIVQVFLQIVAAAQGWMDGGRITPVPEIPDSAVHDVPAKGSWQGECDIAFVFVPRGEDGNKSEGPGTLVTASGNIIVSGKAAAICLKFPLKAE